MKLFLAFALMLKAITAFRVPAADFNSSSALITVLQNAGRVYNGRFALLGQYPYQVQIRNYNLKKFCGGSLIGTEWILTAAHCLLNAKSLDIYLGTTLRSEAQKVISATKEQIQFHRSYSALQHINDIALIKIPAVQLSDTINIVRLPSIGYSYSKYVNEAAVLSGWGSPANQSNEYLRFGVMTVISNEECKKIYGDIIIDNRMCATPSAGAYPCKGDSGGGLVLQSSRVLIGVSSMSAESDCTLGPGIYTRVTNHLQWIKSITGISY